MLRLMRMPTCDSCWQWVGCAAAGAPPPWMHLLMRSSTGPSCAALLPRQALAAAATHCRKPFVAAAGVMPTACLRRLRSCRRHLRQPLPFFPDVPTCCPSIPPQVLATDARATALRRLAVSGSPQLAQDVLGGVGVAGLAVGALRQQEMYQALWSELGLQRAQASFKVTYCTYDM